MPPLVGDDVVRLVQEIEKARRFLAQSRTYLYIFHSFITLLSVYLWALVGLEMGLGL